MNALVEKLGKVLLKVKVLKKDVVLVFSDEEIKISHHTFSDFLLYENKVVSHQQIKEIKKRQLLDTYLQSALNSLARSRFSEKQIKEKLLKKGASFNQVQEVLKILNSSQLLDDESLIKEYVLEYQIKGYGQRRMISSLKEKGFSNELINNLFFDENEEYKRAENLFQQIEKKYDQNNFLNKKQKIYLAYLRLGYKSNLINKLISDNLSFDLKKELKALDLDYLKIKRLKKQLNKEELIEILLRKGYRYEHIFAKIKKGED
ncbi:MAG: regulatory protein RecX [Bacilli bacterium]|jgi:SOS response regulatory protein OraA/RecX|nr:regulatory protein RecX [Bacilli bacterium]